MNVLIKGVLIAIIWLATICVLSFMGQIPGWFEGSYHHIAFSSPRTYDWLYFVVLGSTLVSMLVTFVGGFFGGAYLCAAVLPSFNWKVKQGQ